MKRKNFYEGLTTESLACFYVFVQKKLRQGDHLNRMLFENNLIEKVAKERGISLLELRIIGEWYIQKESHHTIEEINKSGE
ncbi:hypothetical protein [Ornithinibacillus halotolerans]|uniref:Uncharacterized protein n=1 Tax=Ornithinibacillus halotolerans TaxID=1274357 RepID=A0A916S788_9BACI|nr:hypothetical protein [Ornithinibacillus halotolerans]GGA88003.1 hypothetical protein GCM10008025_33400 [Ornithinibacillus halotolerans]